MIEDLYALAAAARQADAALWREVRVQYEAGEPVVNIAGQIGCAVGTILTRLRKMGVDIRHSGRPRNDGEPVAVTSEVCRREGCERKRRDRGDLLCRVHRAEVGWRGYGK